MKKILLLSGILITGFCVNAQEPTFQTVLQNTSGLTANEIISVTKDGSGNMLFCGTHADELALGTLSLPAGQGGAFWGKADGNGNILWLKQGGTSIPISDKALGIATDQNGNVYVCGVIPGHVTATFNGAAMPFGTIGFVLKYNNNGGFLWASALSANIYAIAVDNSGSPIINYGDSGIYKLNPTTGSLIDSAYGLLSGNLQNATWHNIQIDSSNNIIAQAGNKVVKFDTDFNQLWSTPVTSSIMETFRISLDQSGNVYGTFYALFGTVTVGTVTKSDFPNGYIYKLDVNTGAPIFVDPILIAGAVSKIKEVIPSGDNYYISGDGAFNTAHVLKLASDYTVLWDRTLSSNSPVNDVSLISEDCLFLGGKYKSTVTLDSFTLVRPGGESTINNSYCAYLCKGSLGLIDSFDLISDVFVYPNPSKGDFYIKASDNLLNSKVSVYNFLGQKVEEFSLDFTETPRKLKRGMYLINIENQSRRITKKLVVD